MFLKNQKSVIFTSKGDPGKTGEQGSAGVAGQRVSAVSYVSSTLFHHECGPKHTEQCCRISSAVFCPQSSTLKFTERIGYFVILSSGSSGKRRRSWPCWPSRPTCKCHNSLWDALVSCWCYGDKWPLLSDLKGCRRWQRRAGTSRCEWIPGV